MKVLMFDIDTLRSDHMGCYGYKRSTTPTIDSIAKDGVVFDDYYCPNAPCLPSRASLITGQYGIHTGVVGHGGTAADMRLQGRDRHFTDHFSECGLFMQFRRAGMHTVSFSTFPERHSAWWFNSGFNECYNVGNRGGEIAGSVTPHVLEWLEKHAEEDNWFMHVHYWDPHSPYRAPAEMGNPFKDEPLPDDWISEEIFAQHLLHVGPHGANEISMWNDEASPLYPRHPGKITDMNGVREFLDNYDCGIRYTDDNIKQIIDLLKAKGLYDDDLAIIITSDHGENIGELGLYAEHGTADEPTCHIPMIIKWPGCQKDVHAKGFYDNVDLLPTIMELLGVEKWAGAKEYKYDGRSYAQTLLNGKDCSKESLVLTQCCHVCQRSARFDDYIYIRTVHGGFHIMDKEMLFNVKDDPHQLNNLAADHPELCAKGAKIIIDWVDEMMKTSDYPIDPMWTVMKEGGPEHARGQLESYIKRLEGTPRAAFIPQLRAQYPEGDMY